MATTFACSRAATASARVAALRLRPTLLAAAARRSPTPTPLFRRARDAAAPAAPAPSVAARAAAVEAPVLLETDGGEQPISLSPAAMAQLERLRREEAKDGASTAGLLLRMGVRAGGCSGMSYDMKFEQEANIDPEDDTVLEFAMDQAAATGGSSDGEGARPPPPPPPPLRVAVDGKSLLFLFGMQVDYSDALVGGGFKFVNPQATDTCGCGKSFSA